MIRTTPNERKAKKKIKNIPKRIYVIKTSFGTEEIEIRKGKKDSLRRLTHTHTHAITHILSCRFRDVLICLRDRTHRRANGDVLHIFVFKNLSTPTEPSPPEDMRSCLYYPLPYLTIAKRIAPRDGRYGIKDAIVMPVGGLERYEIKWEKINQKGFIPQLPLIPTKRHHSNGEAFVLLQQSRETMLCIKL